MAFTVRDVFGQILNHIFDQIREETQAKVLEGGDSAEKPKPELSANVIRRLKSVLKYEQFYEAIEMAQCVIMMEDPLGRKVFRVDSLNRRGQFYHCYFGVYYCTCSHIAPRRMRKICKHLIATRIAYALNNVIRQEVSTEEMWKKFSGFNKVQ